MLLYALCAQEPEDPPLWLVWKFEGSETLASLMNDKDFPYNMESELFDQPLDMPRAGQILLRGRDI